VIDRWFRREARAPAAGDIEEMLSGHVAWWHLLVPDERDRVTALTAELVERFRWEAAQGFELVDTMRVLIAAQGALMLLGIGDDSALDNVGTIIVHPSTVVRSGEHSVGGGVMSRSPLTLAGEAHHRGPVLISWRAAQRDLRRLGTGTNVVIHELAHKLDMLDGLLDGTPPLVDAGVRDRWVEVCNAELVRLRRGDPSPLRAYAATNPAEFFAVASEVFFDRPLALAVHRPALFDVLRDFYGQDPAARLAAATAAATADGAGPGG